jgi:creatinine amidohydrolase
MAHVAFERLTRDEIGALAPSAVAVLPTAAIEQHGPHNPVGLDTMCCMAVARRAADAAGPDLNAIVCPPLHFGSSHHHLPWPGVLTLTSRTFGVVLYELLDSLRMMGFRRTLILNGHGGNEFLIQQTARDFVLAFREMHVVAGSYWNIARAALEAIPHDGEFSIPGHAGSFETSLMLHLDPDLVKTDRIPVRGDQWPPEGGGNVTNVREGDFPGDRPTGASDDAVHATAELGRRYLEAAATVVAAQIREIAATT